jgi:hypothetical protein
MWVPLGLGWFTKVNAVTCGLDWFTKVSVRTSGARLVYKSKRGHPWG